MLLVLMSEAGKIGDFQGKVLCNVVHNFEPCAGTFNYPLRNLDMRTEQ